MLSCITIHFESYMIGGSEFLKILNTRNACCDSFYNNMRNQMMNIWEMQAVYKLFFFFIYFFFVSFLFFVPHYLSHSLYLVQVFCLLGTVRALCTCYQ